jgi:hypothetical protein
MGNGYHCCHVVAVVEPLPAKRGLVLALVVVVQGNKGPAVVVVVQGNKRASRCCCCVMEQEGQPLLSCNGMQQNKRDRPLLLLCDRTRGGDWPLLLSCGGTRGEAVVVIFV